MKTYTIECYWNGPPSGTRGPVETIIVTGELETARGIHEHLRFCGYVMVTPIPT